MGIGEFVYSYGILSWVTQGIPYYIFAIIFAFFLVPRIRKRNNFTIPEQIKKVYGKNAALITAGLILLLVSPAAYILMIANIIDLIFNFGFFASLILSALISSIYLFWGGFKSDLFTDAFEFFVMFLGFGIIVYVASSNYGGIEFLSKNLPATHLSIKGNATISYIVVWFLIALWTFTDPGFYQRVNSSKNYSVAKYGIIISVGFWFLFDFLTTSTGLYSKAIIPNLKNPVLSFPLLAEKILQPGLKGIFFAGLLATILSTLNSNFFISATTFGKDIISTVKNNFNDEAIILYTRIGLIITSLISIVLAFYFQSVIAIWYTVGSICIPSLLFPVLSSYIKKFEVPVKFIYLELILGFTTSFVWFILKENGFLNNKFSVIEPMIIGITINLLLHLYGIFNRSGKIPDRKI
ncbi:MAG: hypothetical protein Fur0015_05590 [Ignavibacteriales bacterium]